MVRVVVGSAIQIPGAGYGANDWHERKLCSVDFRRKYPWVSKNSWRRGRSRGEGDGLFWKAGAAVLLLRHYWIMDGRKREFWWTTDRVSGRTGAWRYCLLRTLLVNIVRFLIKLVVDLNVMLFHFVLCLQLSFRLVTVTKKLNCQKLLFISN